MWWVLRGAWCYVVGGVWCDVVGGGSWYISAHLEALPLLHLGVELVDRQPELGEGGVQAAHAGSQVTRR